MAKKENEYGELIIKFLFVEKFIYLKNDPSNI